MGFTKRKMCPVHRETRLEWVWQAHGGLMKRTMNGKMEGTNPRRRWMDSIRKTMMKLTQSWEIDWNISYDREKWKSLVLAVKSLNGL